MARLQLMQKKNPADSCMNLWLKTKKYMPYITFGNMARERYTDVHISGTGMNDTGECHNK